MKVISTILPLLFICLLFSSLFIININADDEADAEHYDNHEEEYNSNHDEPTTESTTTPPTPTAPRNVRFIRDKIPPTCSLSIKHNYFVTFSYTAHLVTEDNRVGKKFDETPEYGSITLQANTRQMLPALYRGLLGACIDERRSIIIPHEIANLKDETLPKDTDFVFITTIIDITPFVDYFDIIDINYDGCITKDEFKTYLIEQRKLSATTQNDLITTSVDKLMALHDKDKDGYIECSEFSTTSKNCNDLVCIPVARARAEARRLAELKRLEEERIKREEEERIKREEEERKRKEEEERKRIEEEERIKREEEERERKEEEAEIARLAEIERLKIEIENAENNNIDTTTTATETTTPITPAP